MTFLLDTNICSAHFRRPSGLVHRFIQHSGRLAIPTIVLAGLYSGAFHRSDPKPLLDRIGELLLDVDVLPFDSACAERCGRIRGSLLQQGNAPSMVDIMIASVALAHDLTLVTHNTGDFQRIPGLRLEDWIAA